MFTPEQKRRLIQRLRAARNIHIVTHEDVDQDGAAAAFLIMKKATINTHDDRVHWHFVPAGKLLDMKSLHPSKLPTPWDLVIHVDTGGKIDIEALIFDHHFEGCEYHSATGILFDLLFLGNGFQPARYMQGLVDLIDRIDSGHEVGDLEDEVYDTIGALTDLLVEEHGWVGRFVPNLPGPPWFMTLVKHKPEGAPDILHMLLLVYALECYAQDAKHRYNVGSRFTNEVEPNMKVQDVGGLKVAFVPNSPLPPSDLKDEMNHRHHKDVDVLVAENTAYPAMRGRYTIAILSRKTRFVNGMAALADTIRTSAPQSEVFAHHKGFLIYVREANGVPLPFHFTTLKAMVETHLSKKEPELGQVELPFHKETIPAA